MWLVLSALFGRLTTVATELPPELRRLALLQRGVVSRAQVLAEGLTDEVITARLSRAAGSDCFPASTRSSPVTSAGRPRCGRPFCTPAAARP